MADMDRFAAMLTRCEGVKGNYFSEWEERFISDMRYKFDERDAQSDLGMTMWIPSRSQYNTLHEIWSKI